MITVKEVTNNKKELKKFKYIIYDIYADEPNFAPPLKRMVDDMLDPGKNPFHKHGEYAYFSAYEGDKIVGRITAHIDPLYNERYSEKRGAFGFYEAYDNPEIAKVLMETVEKWLTDRGMNHIVGPLDFSANQDLGFQVEGHDHPNVALMPWTKKYYPDHFYPLGYEKEEGMLSWVFDDVNAVPDSIAKWSERLRNRYDDLEIRNIDMKHMERDTRMIFDIYNEAWSDNWSFVPMTEAEIQSTIKDIKSIVDPRIIYLIFKGGEPAACFVAVPDINRFLIKNRRGNLTPSVMYNMVFNLKKQDKLRVIIMGVRKKFRKLGLDMMIYDDLFNKVYNERNYRNAEMGWILESNHLMNSTLEKIGAKMVNKFIVLGKKV
ncbi:hypothetical protein KAH37_09555 [bacterium]|nr:hypothetical protein [bacterium]